METLALPQHYDYGLMAPSYLVTIVASYTALRFAQGIQHLQSNKITWTNTGAFTLGYGMLVVHFIGMQSLALPNQVSFNSPLTLASLATAIAICWAALNYITTQKRSLKNLLAAGFLIGSVIAMHEKGLAAMETMEEMRNPPSLVAISVPIAYTASLAAINMAVNAMQGDREKWLEGGLDDYLSKPKLYAAVHEKLER